MNFVLLAMNQDEKNNFHICQQILAPILNKLYNTSSPLPFSLNHFHKLNTTFFKKPLAKF